MAVTEASDQLVQIMREIQELTNRLADGQMIPPPTVRLTGSGNLEHFRADEDSYGPTTEDLSQLANSMRQKGYSLRAVRAVLRYGKPRLRGRPVSKLGLAKKVLEAKIAKPLLDWDELATRYCDCGKDHKFQCRERIRKNVAWLKRLIAKYDIELPPPGNKSS